MESTADSSRFTFRELTIWRTRLPNVKLAVLPSSNNRPNPLVSGDKVFVSVFSPGAVWALGREDGKLIWRRDLKALAGPSVHLHRRRLLAQSSHTLYALHPDSGSVLWSFCPYGTEHESIYSSPTGYQDKVYIGDRRGYLHCLDAKTGVTIWRRCTNRAKNNNVNSTPLITDQGLVVVTTNAQSAVAFETETGRPVWKQELKGPAVFGPLHHRNMVVAISQSIRLLDPATGYVNREFCWPDDSVAFATSTPQRLVVALRSTRPQEGSSEVFLLSGSNTQRKTVLRGFCMQFRYSRQTRLIYSSHLRGVDVIDPATATVRCHLTIEGQATGPIALVDAKEDAIYVLTGNGDVHALKHPGAA